MSFEAIVDNAGHTSNDHNSSPGENGSGELKGPELSQKFANDL